MTPENLPGRSGRGEQVQQAIEPGGSFREQIVLSSYPPDLKIMLFARRVHTMSVHFVPSSSGK